MRIFLLCAIFLGLTGFLYAEDPFAGKWKLNLNKSKFDPGPAPKTRIMRISAEPNGYVYEIDNVDAQGNPTNRRNKIIYDGKEYPLSASGDATIAVKKIDDYIHEIVIRQSGKQVQTGHEVVSRDRKTMTRTVKGTTTEGTGYFDILVYDRK